MGVRWTESERETIDKAASLIGQTAADVIRTGSLAYAEYIRKNNGKISLPISFDKIKKRKKP